MAFHGGLTSGGQSGEVRLGLAAGVAADGDAVVADDAEEGDGFGLLRFRLGCFLRLEGQVELHAIPEAADGRVVRGEEAGTADPAVGVARLAGMAARFNGHPQNGDISGPDVHGLVHCLHAGIDLTRANGGQAIGGKVAGISRSQRDGLTETFHGQIAVTVGVGFVVQAELINGFGIVRVTAVSRAEMLAGGSHARHG